MSATYPILGSTPILPEPAPCNFVVARLTIGVTPMVGVQVATAHGVQMYFLDEAAAFEVSAALSRAAANLATVNRQGA